MNGKFAKIVLGCNSEQDIFDLEKEANENYIPYAIITDSGKTEFHNIPTVTCIALGPDVSSKIESITKQFKLL